MTLMAGGGSLRLRLLVMAALAISTLLGLGGVGLALLFKSHVEKFAVGELNTHFEQLVANLRVEANGNIVAVGAMSDPRFARPQGGMYWQIDIAGAASLRSRSMWDETFQVPTPPQGEEEDHAHVLQGPGGVEVMALEKLVIFPSANGMERRFVVTVAMERDRVANAVSSFGRPLMFGLGLLYLGLLGATAATIVLGLSPLKTLKTGIARLRTAQANRLTGTHPAELEPLVSEVNALVAAREKQLDRARQRAANLAHGLKTPLTVLASVASDLSHKGAMKEAEHINLASGQMRDLVDRELARSRMAIGDSGHRALLHIHVKRVVDTLRKAPKGETLDWLVDIPPETRVAMDATDLLELLGNLLDNARKNAKTKVCLWHDGQSLMIEEDGLGVPTDRMASIAKRGVQLDALAPGSGLGLSIVSDLAEVYDFSLKFEKSDLGGLKVIVGLPALS